MGLLSMCRFLFFVSKIFFFLLVCLLVWHFVATHFTAPKILSTCVTSIQRSTERKRHRKRKRTRPNYATRFHRQASWYRARHRCTTANNIKSLATWPIRWVSRHCPIVFYRINSLLLLFFASFVWLLKWTFWTFDALRDQMVEPFYQPKNERNVARQKQLFHSICLFILCSQIEI